MHTEASAGPSTVRPTTTITPDLQSFIEAETRQEAARQAHHQDDCARHRGVSWSGMSPPPFRRRTQDEILLAATRNHQQMLAFVGSHDGRLINAILKAQGLVMALSQTLDMAASCRNRGLHAPGEMVNLKARLDEGAAAARLITRQVADLVALAEAMPTHIEAAE